MIRAERSKSVGGDWGLLACASEVSVVTAVSAAAAACQLRRDATVFGGDRLR